MEVGRGEMGEEKCRRRNGRGEMWEEKWERRNAGGEMGEEKWRWGKEKWERRKTKIGNKQKIADKKITYN